MRYLPTVDVLTTPAPLVRHLQPGQWVQAGAGGRRGRFCGVKHRSGLIVVAWPNGQPGDYFERMRILRRYAVSK